MRDKLNEKTTCLLTLLEEGLQEIKSERKCVPAVCFHRLYRLQFGEVVGAKLASSETMY